jgi:hypothetical protein
MSGMGDLTTSMMLDVANGRHILRPLALAASLPLVAASALGAWRSLGRLYTAYQFNHGYIATDDLTAGHVHVRFEIEVWCLVLGLAVVAFLLLRFWRNPNVRQ